MTTLSLPAMVRAMIRLVGVHSGSSSVWISTLRPQIGVLEGSGILQFTGVLVWQRRDGSSPGWGALVPALLSLTYMMSDLTFFTNYAHPVVYSRADQVVTLILRKSHTCTQHCTPSDIFQPALKELSMNSLRSRHLLVTCDIIQRQDAGNIPKMR